MKILKSGDSGAIVKLLQIALKNMNLYNSYLDGVFGNNTLNSVKLFQEKFNLNTSGIVDQNTWNKLLPYITVPTNIEYSYDILVIVISSLIQKFNILSYGFIGVSVIGNSIPFIKVGNGNNKVVYVASTHANEWITTPVLLKFIEDLCTAYYSGNIIAKYNPKDILNNSTIYIVPMLNPDGVNLVNEDIEKTSEYYILAKTISEKYPSISFPNGWKANIRGIDLNLQFPAGWEDAKIIKENAGYISPAPRDFVGNYPLEAPEAIAIYDFILDINPNLLLTYHSQGNVIYWKYLDYMPLNSRTIRRTIF